ncbi:ABC transporter permease [Hymenobacter profundi]|nr:ABC transporter permease [Hymenobacter profundi]
MIRHLITLMWNRKRANGLLIVEIFLAFVVLFSVGSVGVYTWRNYQTPLGFDYQDVWEIDLNPGTQPRAEQFGTLQRILQRLRSTPGIVSVSRSVSNTPFAFSENSTTLDTGEGTPQGYGDVYDADAELPEVMGLRIVAGRWFDRRDDAVSRRPPVVITELMQRALFPDGQSAIGKTVRASLGKPEEFQVIGVSGPYRAGGELSEPRPGFFLYVSPQDTARAMQVLLVRVRPGAGAALEKRITNDVRAINASWEMGVNPLPTQRLAQLKVNLAPPVILGMVCIFLIVNVALGLFGVLWLNISRRRGEIGVRRAMGATAGNISLQVLGEILVLTTFGLGLGLLVAAQFPLLGVMGVQTGVYLTAMLLAAGLLYLLATVCALYPSRLAAGIQPAVALREE